MRQRLEPQGLLEQLEPQEALELQVLVRQELPESLADRDQRGQPELLELMVLQELLA
jgi:hypothetical protein